MKAAGAAPPPMELAHGSASEAPPEVPAIPITRLTPGLRALGHEVQAAIARVLESGVFVGGPEVEAFEAELARYLGVRACVGVNSGTDALVIGLRALGVRPGDEVLVPAFGFIATAEAVSAVGAVPVFVDIDRRSFNLDAGALETRVTARTKGLIAVHLFGQAAPMTELDELCRRHDLWLLEDAAQALGGSFAGRRLGSLGRAAAISFFPTKNLGACGDAGMLATDDLALAAAARVLRQHGSRSKYVSELVGYNSRLDALQAAILRVRLPFLDEDVERRRLAASRYDALLEGLPLERPYRDPRAQHAFHQYTLLMEAARRDGVRRALAARGIESVVYYPLPLPHQPVYASHAQGEFPSAEAACRRALSLPLWPTISAREQQAVAAALRAALC